MLGGKKANINGRNKDLVSKNPKPGENGCGAIGSQKRNRRKLRKAGTENHAGQNGRKGGGRGLVERIIKTRMKRGGGWLSAVFSGNLIRGHP